MRSLRHSILPLAAATVLALIGTGTAAEAAPAPAAAKTRATAGALTASGSEAASVGRSARLSNGTPVDSAKDIAALERFWTPERMAKAVSLDKAPAAPRPDAAKPDPAKSAGPTGKPGSIPSAPARSDLKAPRINESAAAGKVFFTNPSDGGTYTCSASALNSSSKQMVITAGHCVHGGKGGTWMTNWVYVPRYRSGARPFGTFAAKQMRTFTAWMNDSDLRRDVAMVTTWPLNGNKIVNVTGGHGLSWNFSRQQAVTILGYPGNHDGGEVQWACTGTTRAVSDGRIEIQCNFGGGSSGGPWLREFNDSNGLGSVNGVMSTVNSDGWNRSSYFDDGVKGMYDAQGGVT
ncbi:trypsin-like serine peptidase [Streptomyces sp. MA5143a]|uniref:trypsin-like serine peptidase n=1 Tax=Streptomyces sp. MA5143a TaxID=2083010 RepID=UPI000D1B8A6E|nr:trypsin-like peptidase domain-containing protein [Streptomyces sp. MA5143a]SPE99491.1 Extracellular metalloprotease precursor [Streptomyces sp. MA5143a]